nr:SBBP repeat-containing protein [Bacteroidota bacterium]
VPLWAHRGGGPLSDKGQSIAISKDAVYVTGYIRDTALFNNDGAIKAISAGKKDAFIAKYDLSGNLIWLKRGGGPNDDEGSGITVDAEGFIYVTGQIDGDVNFDGVAVKSKGGRDAYLVKYDPAGNLIWIKNEGGSSREAGMGVKAAKDGRIYVTGSFSSKASFGTQSVSSNGSSDIFVACFTKDGQVVWAKNAGGSLADAGLGIASDDDSNVYITGNYGISADFNGQVINGKDSAEIFIAKYDSNGEFKWVMNIEGKLDTKYESQHEEAGRSIWVDSKKFVLVTGSYRTDAVLGPFNLQGWANTDIFTTKIKQAESDESAYDTGIEVNISENHFKVYPVPSTGVLNITYSGNETLNIKLKLESLEGKILMEKHYLSSQNGTEIIMLNGIAKGIYFLQIGTEKEQVVRKIIIR